MTSRPHIAIIGSALSGNKGAAAMLESAIHTLRERLPEPRFTLFSMYPQEDAAQNRYPDLEIIPATPKQLGVTINALALGYRLLPFLRPLLRRSSRSIAALASADVLLDQGGITFTDGREKFLLYNVASILPALNLRTPVFKCAQAVGPFENRINRIASRIFLPRVRTLVTRGRITHEYAEGLGLTNLVAGADYAFSLELSGSEEADLSRSFDMSFFDADRVVGVCPSVVLEKKVTADGRDYRQEVVDFIDRLTADGRKAALIPHSVRTGTDKTHNNDLPLVRDIHQRLRRPEAVFFADQELTSQQLRQLIGRCDTFIASRFHAMVSSLATGVPTLVIGWSHKYQEVLEMFRMERWAFGHRDMLPAQLGRRFDELDAARDEIRATLADRLGEVKRISVHQADLIADLVRSGRG